MIEPRAGVFIGVMSALVREKLWEKVRSKSKGGAALMIHSARNEQGFKVQTWGDSSREPVDLEGLTLIRRPTSAITRRRGSRKAEPEEEVQSSDSVQ
jgi:CRISPR-associated protein Cas2